MYGFRTPGIAWFQVGPADKQDAGFWRWPMRTVNSLQLQMRKSNIRYWYIWWRSFVLLSCVDSTNSWSDISTCTSTAGSATWRHRRRNSERANSGAATAGLWWHCCEFICITTRWMFSKIAVRKKIYRLRPRTAKRVRSVPSGGELRVTNVPSGVESSEWQMYLLEESSEWQTYHLE